MLPTSQTARFTPHAARRATWHDSAACVAVPQLGAGLAGLPATGVVGVAAVATDSVLALSMAGRVGVQPHGGVRAAAIGAMPWLNLPFDGGSVSDASAVQNSLVSAYFVSGSAANGMNAGGTNEGSNNGPPG